MYDGSPKPPKSGDVRRLSEAAEVGAPDETDGLGGPSYTQGWPAGARSDIEVQDPLGNLRTDVRWYVFDNGRARFLGILPDRAMGNPPAEALVVKLSAQAHVYDVRRRQYLGHTDLLRTGILPAEAKLLRRSRTRQVSGFECQ
ncbi:MAG: hypothetical protein NTY19_52135 [Planctomycetota bacterium]|nr:hypothetical protein [Planctomycetota bacterium]